jgi:hypothetical protein
VHILFAVATNNVHAPGGATVLVDNIRFDPTPTSRQSALGFPLSNQTFGVVRQETVPIPSDQLLRNLTTIYESSLTQLALLKRGTPQDLEKARMIAETLRYALHHENHGDPLPAAPDGSVGLHNGYEDGDILLFNSQPHRSKGKPATSGLPALPLISCVRRRISASCSTGPLAETTHSRFWRLWLRSLNSEMRVISMMQ